MKYWLLRAFDRLSGAVLAQFKMCPHGITSVLEGYWLRNNVGGII